MLYYLYVISCLILLVSCNKPEENPENLDPIYRDLQTQQTNAQKDVVTAQKDLEAAHAAYKSALRDSKNSKQRFTELFAAKRAVELAEQKAKYFEIRVFQRRHEARSTYIKSYVSKSSWPDPDEYTHYVERKKARISGLKWSDTYSDRLKKHQESMARSPSSAASASAPASGH